MATLALDRLFLFVFGSKEQNDRDLTRFRKTAKKFNLPEDQIFDQPISEELKGAVSAKDLEGFSGLTPEEQAELQQLEAANVGG